MTLLTKDERERIIEYVATRTRTSTLVPWEAGTSAPVFAAGVEVGAVVDLVIEAMGGDVQRNNNTE
jgi:hypothetical protein